MTGGARGIGRACCETLAELGSDVVIADVAIEAAEDLAGDLREKFGIEALGIEIDVTEYDDAVAMVETVTDELGSLDLLVNSTCSGNGFGQ